jgi:lysozyme
MDIELSLMSDEGFSSKPYGDTLGHLTIGYGFNLDDGMTKEEALLLLKLKISKKKAELERMIPIYSKSSQAVKFVLENMAYNMGTKKLLTFVNFLRLLEEGRMDEAADEMLDSLWANQVGDRAVRLSNIIRKA